MSSFEEGNPLQRNCKQCGQIMDIERDVDSRRWQFICVPCAEQLATEGVSIEWIEAMKRGIYITVSDSEMASRQAEEVTDMGGKPNPGTKPDRRLKENQPPKPKAPKK